MCDLLTFRLLALRSCDAQIYSQRFSTTISAPEVTTVQIARRWALTRG